MAMTINTNLSAITVTNSLNANQTALSDSMAKLSSGSQLNTAADNPAGLAISQGLQAQIGGLTQAGQNTASGINLIQTASGALSQVSNILQTINSLAVQAANDTNNTASRTDIQTQVTALAGELTQIGSSTNFNGVKLLDGSATGTAALNFQVGSSATDTVSLDLGSANVTSIATAVSGLKFDNATDAQASITAIQTQIQTVSTAQATLGSTQNVLQSTAQSIAVNSQNLTAANSQIADTDMASEMAKYSKESVLMQAGTAMLSQANQQSQLILKILQG
ncbi:flagellin N-terminal helical domain-containing protein [Curtobacterium ammoniigenes]|uniref:flagellin N-terminal helical domain-containing protein n=1 Tax=Curtobacterium ammoniigenes TaxID=395387 RepID=UPI0008333CA7|nr:flagellin [Curtobacterium ammoniigenes]